jgi:anaerobic selenocysteine-containing dehydrogenase
LHLHPSDAATLGASDGARVRVVSAAGELEGTASITEHVRAGTVSLTHGLVAGNVNDLVGAFDVDPLTGQPVMSAIDVRVELIAERRSSHASSP